MHALINVLVETNHPLQVLHTAVTLRKVCGSFTYQGVGSVSALLVEASVAHFLAVVDLFAVHVLLLHLLHVLLVSCGLRLLVRLCFYHSAVDQI